MNPDIQPLEPIDPPDNTGGGRITDDDENPEPSEAQAQPRALAIDPPDNTGGG